MKLNSTFICIVAVLLIAFLAGCSDDQSTSPVQQKIAQQENNSRQSPDVKINNPEVSMKNSILQKTASTGNDHGYFWQCYVSGGSASISFPSAGTYAGNFAVTWSNVGDVVAGKGWNPGSSHSIGYNIGSLNGSYNNFSVYGWTTNPLIEYYVCEKGSVASGSVINSITSDGHTYNFYKHQQVNQPSIQGTATFWQYLDNWGGTSLGANHTVTTANHINNWRNRGGQGFGNYNLQILAVEAYGGKSGNCNATVWGQ